MAPSSSTVADVPFSSALDGPVAWRRRSRPSSSRSVAGELEAASALALLRPLVPPSGPSFALAWPCLAWPGRRGGHVWHGGGAEAVGVFQSADPSELLATDRGSLSFAGHRRGAGRERDSGDIPLPARPRRSHQRPTWRRLRGGADGWEEDEGNLVQNILETCRKGMWWYISDKVEIIKV
jgi:hypothetical protein